MVLIGNSGGNIEVGWRKGPEANAVLADIQISPETVRKMIDEYLRGVVEFRFKDLGGDAKIAKEADRRIEVAIAGAGRLLETDLLAVMRQAAEERVRRAIADIPISVNISVQVGSPVQ